MYCLKVVLKILNYLKVLEEGKEFSEYKEGQCSPVKTENFELEPNLTYSETLLLKCPEDSASGGACL